MRLSFTGKMIAAVLLVVAAAVIFGTFERPPIDYSQRGYRGTGMVQDINPRLQAIKVEANQVPAPLPPEEASGQPASAVYSNVQVLKDVDAAELMRLMNAMTAWVAPQQGCTYCHSEQDLASDDLYTKRVARRMIQMTQHINADWKNHVAGTGVTCYTCHRGQPVPANIWFDDPGPRRAGGFAQAWQGQNHPTKVAGYTSLPEDVFSPFLNKPGEIRVVSTAALPGGTEHSIKQAEWTYGLMMHFSQSLGVNCTYCHNTRSFTAWDQSTPQRGIAWYGIRMVRDLNNAYLDPLASTFPHNRLGPLGDGPKLNCATCHQGVYKPLFGVSMVKDYQELAPAKP
jgi:photosynthetic reaction center cytochrome c subunit